MDNPRLYMAILGCTPKGRITEQHDTFFGIGQSVLGLKPDIYAFWPDAGQLHIDSWREVTMVDGYSINIIPKQEAQEQPEKLFFLNLGGYRPGELEEYHFKVLVVAHTMAQAIRVAKKTTFYKEYSVKSKGGESHIDEKYALDVDDMHKVEDILPEHLKALYHIKITPALLLPEDELHIGYVKLGKP